MNKQNQSVRNCGGIVLYLDVLGVRGYSQVETKEHLVPMLQALKESYDGIINELLVPFSNLLKLVPDFRSSQPLMVSFGDSIIVYWDIGVDNRSKMCLPYFAKVLPLVMMTGINLELRMRGSVAFGKFIVVPDEHGQSVLGDAVNDAATWHDKADWLGIALTPTCGNVLDTALSLVREHGPGVGVNINDMLDLLKDYLIRYPVPMKHGEHRELWSVAWPSLYPDETIPLELGLVERNWKDLLMKRLDQDPWPEETRQKRTNTLAFYDWYWRSSSLDSGS